jgi:hypothetical protein
VASRRIALLNRLHSFPFQLANAITREPRRRAATPAQHVQVLASRHGAACARTLKHSKIPHARGTTELVLVPFLLAGFYLARMLAEVARQGRPGLGFVNIADEGRRALDEAWGSVGFARTLFPLERDQEAWWKNCGAAAAWIEKLLHAPHESVALIRRCKNPACPAPFEALELGGPSPREPAVAPAVGWLCSARGSQLVVVALGRMLRVSPPSGNFPGSQLPAPLAAPR